MASRVHMHY